MREEDLALRGQLQPAGTAFQEPRAQLTLERRDLV
jgi:hypothetical protein